MPSDDDEEESDDAEVNMYIIFNLVNPWLNVLEKSSITQIPKMRMI
jgi:hypothetical protein